MIIPKTYYNKISTRTFTHKIIGLVPRVLIFVKFALFRLIARMKGAKIGHDSVISFHTAITANRNLTIGEDCVVFAKHLDLRGAITIKDHVIINKDVTILRLSHSLESPAFETINYPNLIIDDYAWLATGASILPRVTKIGQGAVCAAYSVVSKNCEDDLVYAGNPACSVKARDSRHSELVVCSMNGGDLRYYLKSLK